MPPTWSGQRFDIWRNEVEKWYEENRNPEANKYQDLTESLKLIKDEKVRTYVNKTLLERMRDKKNVKKVLDILEEKYKKTKCERIKEVERKWIDFRADDKVDILIDRLEEIVTEMETLGLLNDMRKYAISAKFIYKMEEGGKINFRKIEAERHSAGCRR